MAALFGGGETKAAEPTRMPSMNDAVAKAASDRQRRRILGRSGRSSTRLSEDTSRPYRNSLLGQA